MMKRWIAAWFQYSRTERIGMAVLAIVFALLVGIRLTMHLFVHPPAESKAAEERFRAAYNEWQANSEVTATHEKSMPESSLFYFDPNTLDSLGFIRLGMPPRAVRGLLHWRLKGKHFYKPEDLRPLYNLPEEVYARLLPYIRIESAAPRYEDRGFARMEAPSFIELNTADSAMLERFVPGIGPTLAHKIVQRRKALGGFISFSQLREVYAFPDSALRKLEARLHLDPSLVRKKNLATTTLADLASHPYIGEKMAANILMYRDGIGAYRRLEQLRQVPLMNEENYRKIAPYLTLGILRPEGQNAGAKDAVVTEQ